MQLPMRSPFFPRMLPEWLVYVHFQTPTVVVATTVAAVVNNIRRGLLPRSRDLHKEIKRIPLTIPFISYHKSEIKILRA